MQDAQAYASRNKHVTEPNPDLVGLIKDLEVDSVLEIGQANGRNITWMKERWPEAQVVGTELPEYAHDLRSWSTEDFELVVFCHVLMYVPANFLLQSLGEAFRVSGSYLAIVDYEDEPTKIIQDVHRDDGWTYHRRYDLFLQGIATKRKRIVRTEEDSVVSASLWEKM